MNEQLLALLAGLYIIGGFLLIALLAAGTTAILFKVFKKEKIITIFLKK